MANYSSKNLVVENISASYFNDGKEVSIFEKVSFVAKRGQVLALFGSNGSGKSTLLRVIAGLKKEKTGGIIYPDSNLEGVTIIPQDYRLSFFSWASLELNILLVMPNPIRNKNKNLKRIYEVCKNFCIDIDLSLKPQSCSGGMLQQAAIVRAFVSKPLVVLADEPFSALDVSISSKLRKAFFKQVKENNIIAVIVLHDLHDIVEVSDEVFVISKPPFSTEKDTDTNLAVLIKNKNINKRDSIGNLSFIEIAENILSKKGF